jgi:hypothetical protein
MTLLCKEINVEKSKEVKTGSNLAESSMESYGLKMAVLPIMLRAIYIYTHIYGSKFHKMFMTIIDYKAKESELLASSDADDVFAIATFRTTVRPQSGNSNIQATEEDDSTTDLFHCFNI